jgi:ABC transport system ATP-binding/permease protein
MASPLRAYRPQRSQPFRIGRTAPCEVILPDPAVSRLHATISWQTGEGWLFENHSTTSGSWLGEQKIDRHVLQDGDSIQAGVQQLRFVIQGDELTVLHIAPNDSACSLPLPENKRLHLGRNSTELAIAHPSCPQTLAFAQRQGDNCLLRFQVPTYDDHKKKRRKISMTPGSWIDLPWGALHFQSGQLALHPRAAGLHVQVENLEVIKNGRTLLYGIDFDLEPGQLLSIIGLSGQGKSTFLHALGNASKNHTGHITLDGKPHHLPELQDRVAFLPQDPLLRDYLTVQETLQAAARLRLPADHQSSEIADRIQGLLSLAALEHRANTSVRVLSGGERRRLALATQLMGGPGLLLLDEPLSGLDPVNASKLCTHLRQLAWLGHTILLTTHSYSALDISDRVLVLHEGAQAFFGNRTQAFQFFSSPSAEALLVRLTSKSGADWSTLYRRSSLEQTRLATRESSEATATTTLYPRAHHPSAFKRHLVLETRQWTRDHGRLVALVLQPLLIGLLLRQVFLPGSSLWAAAFALLLCANWFALSLSIRSIVSERALLADETRTHGGLLALFSAKSTYPLLFSMLQCLLAWLLFGPALGIAPPLHLVALILATTLVPAVAAGIGASAACRNAGQANALLPLLLIPQVALAGALAPLDQMSAIGSSIAQFLWSSHTQRLLQDLFTWKTPLSTSFFIPTAIALAIFIIDLYLLARLRKNP